MSKQPKWHFPLRCSSCGATCDGDKPTCGCLAEWRAMEFAVMAFMVACLLTVVVVIVFALVFSA